MRKSIKLSTPVVITPKKDKILCETNILTLGSCFSDNIGKCLSTHLFDTLTNPFGTVFNPISMAKVLSSALTNEYVAKADLDMEGNRYFHYDFHSSFDHSDPIKVADNVNAAIKNVGEYIINADFLVLTFGTSIVYKIKANDRIVSNCHKVPNKNFHKKFLTVDFMQEKMEEVIGLVRRINPRVKIILTVSPVRHTKEGLIENSLSKSRLIDLCHRIIEKNSETSYFPAFEIMMDEMRDYRFYESDLIHPSKLAIDIIWSRFMDVYFDENAIQKVQDISELNAAKNHKPFDANSEEYQKFKKNQLSKIERLKEIYPEVNFLNYKQYFAD